MKNFFRFVAIISLFSFMAGCAKAPVKDMATAHDALEAARIAEAKQYAPDQYNVAGNTFDSAMVEIKIQDSKLSFLRNYAKAQKLLKSAVLEADIAKEISVANKIRMQEEVAAANLAKEKLNASKSSKGKSAKKKTR